MLGRLLALFLITPIVELALLIRLGEWIGFWPTIGIIAATGITGTFLAKKEGLSVWKRFNARLQGGELPGRELLDGVIILVAGALLITPGVLTDVAGFIGLIPPSRRLLRTYLNGRIQKAAERGSVGFSFGSFGSYQAPPPGSPQEPSSSGSDVDAEWQGRPSNRPQHRPDV